jgi:hypothetical protein
MFTAFRWRTSESNDEIPYTHHGYAYALSNPVLYTDRTGRAAAVEPGSATGCLWDLELGRCRTEVEHDPESGTGQGPPIVINIDYNGPLIFTQPAKLPNSAITPRPDELPDRVITTQPGGDPGILITKPSDPLPTCNIFERQPDLFPGYLTNDAPRRPGLPTRADGGWQKGQLTDAEYEFLRSLAKKWGRDIVLTGSLSETDRGLRNRENPALQGELPPFRRNKPESGLVKGGKGDIDIWQGSGLRPEQLNELLLGFNILNGERNEQFDLGDPSEGYNLRRYPNIHYFGRKAGAIVFAPDGTTVRIPAPWQYKGWPKDYPDYAHPRAEDDVG